MKIKIQIKWMSFDWWHLNIFSFVYDLKLKRLIAFWSQNKTLKPKRPPRSAFWSLPIQAKLSVFLISTKFFIVEDNRYNLRSWWSWIEHLQINIIYFHVSDKIKANEKISEIYEMFLEWRQEDTVSRDNSQSTSWISNFHCDLPCRHQNGETWLYVTFPL